MTKRIAVITTHIPPVMGGIEVHCDNLARALAEAGHDVLLYGSLEADQAADMVLQVKASNLLVRRIPTVHRPVVKRPIRLRNLLRQVAQDHRQRPFDLIHAHQFYPVGIAAAIAARKLGCPLVITEHGSILDDSTSRWKRPLIRWAGDNARHIVTASRELATTVIDAGIPHNKVSSIPNAIWAKHFQQTVDKRAARAALSLPADAFLLMTVRRLVPKTGVQYAIKAIRHCANRIPNLHLAVIGDGPLRHELEVLAKEVDVPDRVTFHGTVPNEEIPHYMSAADLGLFPSLAEATSIAALEFMANGIPVVASTVGGLPEIIDDGRTGFLVDFGFTRSTYHDPGLSADVIESFAKGIERAYSSDTQSIGEAARCAVHERFTWAAYVRHLQEKIYPPLS